VHAIGQTVEATSRDVHQIVQFPSQDSRAEITVVAITDLPAHALLATEMELGQWVMDHGSNGSPFLDGSRGSRDPLTHDDEITAQYSLHFFLLLVGIKKLLTHSVSPIIIAGDLILIYDIFALMTEYHNATPPPSPMGRMK